jgi:hypothetical protein
MEVKGVAILSVTVNPIDVLEKLLSNDLSRESWISENDGKYYINTDYHRTTGTEEITKKQYDYIKSLQYVIETLKRSNKDIKND